MDWSHRSSRARHWHGKQVPLLRCAKGRNDNVSGWFQSTRTLIGSPIFLQYCRPEVCVTVAAASASRPDDTRKSFTTEGTEEHRDFWRPSGEFSDESPHLQSAALCAGGTAEAAVSPSFRGAHPSVQTPLQTKVLECGRNEGNEKPTALEIRMRANMPEGLCRVRPNVFLRPW